jgi:hypothetical protein
VVTIGLTTGLATAVGYGTATIRYRPLTPDYDYLLTHGFMLTGISTTVTVPQPPPAALVIDSIGLNTALPITLGGSYQLTAHLAPGDDTGVTYQFMIIYSSAPADTHFVNSRQSSSPQGWIDYWPGAWGTPSSGKTIGLSVPMGSYTIRVVAWPWRGSSSGPWTIQDLTVCADDEDEEEHMSRFKGEESPNTVEGCPPP